MNKRSHNQGTVFQDASTSRWVAEVSAGYDETGKRKRIRRKARTKTEALLKLKDMQRQVDDGVPTGRAAMTISELLDFFLDTVVMSRDPSANTVDNYKWTYSHIKPALGRKKLTNLTAIDVERFLVHRRDNAALSKNSLQRLKSHLASAIEEAERRDWIHRNVARIARVPQSHTKQRRSLTPDQARQLLDAASSHRLEAAIFVGLTRGLRPGEILGLRWSDLDLEASPPVLHIRQAIKRENNQLRLGEPKTAKSKRSLVIPEVAVVALRSHRRVQNEERLRNGDVWHELDLVFCTEIGTLIDPSNFRREFKKHTRTAGLGDWTPYEMRHSAASLLVAMGVPIEEVADLFGHKDATIMSVYRHDIAAAVDAGSTAIASALSNPIAQSHG